MPQSQPWGLSIEYYDDDLFSHNILPEDDDELHWELAHALHETDTLVDPDDYTAQFCAVLNEKDWTNPAVIGDTATIMRPYIQMIDEIFDVEDLEYTENVQARYFDQLSWMFLHTYARFHLKHTNTNDSTP